MSHSGKKYKEAPGEFDILLGRGKHLNYHPGNVYFRMITAKRAIEYVTAETSVHKDRIHKEVVQAIRQRGGDFLKKCNDDSENPAFEIVSGGAVSSKVKQALRDAAVHLKKHQHRALQSGLNAAGIAKNKPVFSKNNPSKGTCSQSPDAYQPYHNILSNRC